MNLTVHGVLPFNASLGVTLHVKQPAMPHWQWDCFCFVEKEPDDLNGEVSIEYAGQFSFAATISNASQPNLEFTRHNITRNSGGCDMNAPGLLDFIINIAEEQLCDLL